MVKPRQINPAWIQRAHSILDDGGRGHGQPEGWGRHYSDGSIAHASRIRSSLRAVGRGSGHAVVDRQIGGAGPPGSVRKLADCDLDAAALVEERSG